MVRERRENIGSTLKRMAEEFDEQNPIVQTGWAVQEVRDAYNTGGYYDQDIPEERRTVSPIFKEEITAEIWMQKHVADKDKYLEVVEFRQREYRPKPYLKWERVRRRK